MSSGTTLNGVVAYRLHRTNAEDSKEEAENYIERCRQQLIAMAIMTPTNCGEDFIDVTLDTVNEAVDMIMQEAVILRNAEYLLMYPEECDDDNDPE